MWTINNQKTTFDQTDIITQATTTAENTSNSSFTVPGNVKSTLHIVDIQYPIHDGVYTCIGSNFMDMSINTNSVNITVRVQGKLTE